MVNVIRPQKGFQEKFLTTNADIAIGGGAAGVGKTFAEILCPLYYKHNPNFGSVFFRKTYPQITNTGALWDQSHKVYSLLKAKPDKNDLKWTFPSGATIKFNHLQHEKDVYSHQGSEYPQIIFDELTHFSESSFWYLISRNRSTCGVVPHVRATCNPDPDSFVARLIEWWINQETGFPIKERIGIKRYFIRDNGNMIWGGSKQEVKEQAAYLLDSFPEDINRDDLIKSLTFIDGSIYDNKELLSINPQYLSNLLSQDATVKSQLLEGNWKVRQDNSALFHYERINDIFSNNISNNRGSYLSCDAARFGRDLCVIMAWSGWEVVHIEVMKKSDVHDIIKKIEAIRVKFHIPKSNCVIDQDGVGADTVSMGGYMGFSGGSLPKKVSGLKENFKNFKTQCYYYLAEKKVNLADIKINVNSQTCVVDDVLGTKIKLGSGLYDIKDLIKADLKSIKRGTLDIDQKKTINSKEEQKVIIGRSPDFADTLMMRCYFEFINTDLYL